MIFCSPRTFFRLSLSVAGPAHIELSEEFCDCNTVMIALPVPFSSLTFTSNEPSLLSEWIFITEPRELAESRAYSVSPTAIFPFAPVTPKMFPVKVASMLISLCDSLSKSGLSLFNRLISANVPFILIASDVPVNRTTVAAPRITMIIRQSAMMIFETLT